MAAKKHSEEEEVIVDVVGNYNKIEQFIEHNKNTITYIIGGLAIVIGGYFAYTNLYLKPLEEEASNEMWKAQQYFVVDSLDKALAGDGNYLGFEDIADQYGATKAGKLANFYIGLIYKKKGEYDAAIDYLSDFNSSDVLVSAAAIGVTGDCYSELGDDEEAMNHYIKAARKNANEFSTPIFLMKAGKAAERIGDYKKAVSLYEELSNDYGNSQEGREVEKYLFRAKTLAEAK
ncbi:MAG: tetratricopeptide repeat protein [Flavobacteriales bacterium]|nr:tetratricopeptide repeat protein [Flavobacteriales bacterium]